MRPEDIRAFVERDRSIVDESRVEHWNDLRARLGVGEALRIADELRREVLAAHPDWPTPAERADDLATHLRVSEILRRVRPAARRLSCSPTSPPSPRRAVRVSRGS